MIDVNNKEISDKLDGLDWPKMNVNEATQLGLQITFYGEANSVKSNTKQNVVESMCLFSCLGFIFLVGSMIGIGLGAMLVSVTTLLFLKLIYDFTKFKLASHAEQTQLGILHDDIETMSKKYQAEEEPAVIDDLMYQ